MKLNFAVFLCKNGLSDRAAVRAIALVQEFENFYHKHFAAGLDDDGPAALEPAELGSLMIKSKCYFFIC